VIFNNFSRRTPMSEDTQEHEAPQQPQPQPQEQSHAERVEQQRAEEAAREGGRGA
jgi:hypothetical protein